MKFISHTFFFILFTLTIISCGKRGDLLPPEGYQPPQEEQPQ